MPCHLFVVSDLDGTLADDGHREHHITGEEKDWNAYFQACDRDKPIKTTIAVLNSLFQQGHRIEIWTGRSEVVREKTVSWLSSHGVPYHRLLMRPEKIYCRDIDLKSGWLKSLEPMVPDLVFEDRKATVAFYRNQGITCYEVAHHDF